METIGEFIFKRRTAVDKSMRDIEREAGVNASYISKMEKGVSYPFPKILKKLAGPLQTPYDELMKRAGYWPDIEGEKLRFFTLPEEVSKGLTDEELGDVLKAAYEEAKRVAEMIKKYK